MGVWVAWPVTEYWNSRLVNKFTTNRMCLPSLEEQTNVVLTKEEAVDLLTILDNPPKPTTALLRALKRKR